VKSAKPKGKTCTKCKEEKPFSEFTTRVASKDGLGHRCKPCVSLYQAARRNGENRERILAEKRDWFKKNKEEIAIRSKAHYEANKERILAQNKVYRSLEASKAKAKTRYKSYYEANKERILAVNKIWNKTHKEQLRGTTKKWRKRKWNNDPLYKLKMTTNLYIRLSMRYVAGAKKQQRTCEILGCSIPEFKVYIEKQFKEGMTWGNWGKSDKEWQLDHIVPVSLGTTEEEIVRLNHHSNLQPLWAKENMTKSNKLILGIISSENKIKYKEIIERAKKQRSR
jgi:hypothetical protein